MKTLIPYMIATVISSGIFYLAFIFLLRKEALFRFNRIYLLSALLLSFLIPLMIFFPEFSLFSSVQSGNNRLFRSILLSPVVISSSPDSSADVFAIMTYLYLIGAAFFLTRLLMRLGSIYQIRKQSVSSWIEEVKVFWSSENIPPFSFFQTMYLPVNLKDAEHTSEIIRHEHVHIRSFHSLDIALTQLLQIVSWFNPFIPLIENALRENHEFEADKIVIGAGTDPVTYTKILFRQDKIARAVVLGNNFNYSLIKRRLTMFYRKSTTLARVKAALVLPLATFCVLFYTFSCTPSAEKKASLNEDTVSNGSAKVTLIKDSAGNVIGTAATGGAAGVPPPPPPPPPPPAAVPGQTIAFQDPVFKVVEVMPGFPGGDEARVQFMAKNMRYPETAIENKTEGTVYVTFVIEKDGSVKDAKVIRGIGGDCDKEALRVVKSMPKWTPGQQDGKPVRVQFTMPLQFRLSNNDKLGLINTGKVG